jgi:hypothetical protein
MNSGGRVHHKPGWFINNRNGIVFINDLKRDIFGVKLADGEALSSTSTSSLTRSL